MIVGILILELHLLEADSLKSKRFVIKSLKDRIKNRFNVSIAEVDACDLWQRSVLGAACVANETRIINQNLNGIMDMVLKTPSVELINSTMKML